MSVSQRWRNRAESYRPSDDDAFVPRHHEIHLLVGAGSDNTARRFVEEHHYSGSLPNSSSYRFLLIDTRRPSWGDEQGVVGVAAFGMPAGPRVLQSSFGFLDSPKDQSCELTRLVLLDEVRKHGESWFVARCMEHLRRHTDMRGIVSFSDPVPRIDAVGQVYKPGHVGIVYQALNACYTGRSRPRWAWYRDNGDLVHERDLTKVRAVCFPGCCTRKKRGSGKSTSGAWGAVERLVSWGARRPSPERECLHDWLDENLPLIASRRRHGGNHRYLWGLNRATRKALRRMDGSLAYPKTPDSPLVNGGAR